MSDLFLITNSSPKIPMAIARPNPRPNSGTEAVTESDATSVSIELHCGCVPDCEHAYIVKDSCEFEEFTAGGAVIDNESADGDPTPLPSQLVAVHEPPVPVVPDAGVKVQDQPLLVPVFEEQAVCDWRQT